MAGELQKMSREQAVQEFGSLGPAADSQPTSDLEVQLRARGIAEVQLPIDKHAFQALSDQYGVCIDEHEQWLSWTAGTFNVEGVPEDGHVRKELGFNPAGMQISDPKNLFHFNPALSERWVESSKLPMPREFVDFMDHGFDLHGQLTKSAKNLIDVLKPSYKRLDKFFFPGEIAMTTFRLLRYDGYATHDENGKLVVEQNAQVAKPHYDRGGMTIQAYSSAPGFWMQTEGERGPEYDKIKVPHGEGKSQMFFASGFRAVYGSKSPIKPLYHGVDRFFDEGAEYIPARTAAILFVDPPLVDLRIKSTDTQPDRADQENLNV